LHSKTMGAVIWIIIQQLGIPLLGRNIATVAPYVS